MKRFLLLALAGLLAFPPPLHSQDIDVSWRAKGEIARRGPMVEYVGGYGAVESPISDVMQLPADDSGKWVITLVTTRGCAYCEKLRSDFAGSPVLKAWVDTTDHKKSWAHYQVIQIEDKSQDWRWKDFRPTQFPTLLVQPPQDHSWGDPHVIVFRQQGYDGKPDKLDAALRKTITAYAVKVNKIHGEWKAEQIAKAKKASGGLAKPGDGGMGDDASTFLLLNPLSPLNIALMQAPTDGTGQSGAWTPPVPPAPPLQTPTVAPTPSTFPPAPATPAADPTGGLSDQVVGWAVSLGISLLGMFFPDIKTILLALTAISNVILYIHSRRQQAGLPVLIPDSVLKQVTDAIKNAAGPSPPPSGT